MLVGCPDGDGESDDCGDGGDKFAGDWPVDGANGAFVLDCAKAILTQLAIVAKPIAIIAETSRIPIILDYVDYTKIQLIYVA